MGRGDLKWKRELREILKSRRLLISGVPTGLSISDYLQVDTT